MRPPLRRSLAPLLLCVPLLGLACGPTPAAGPDGRGLELQPHDGPLAHGVTTRDPRLNFHDFGRVQGGETVTHVFQLLNTDPRDVSILRVDPGCGCTGASLRAVRKDGSVERGESIHSKTEKLLTVAPGEMAEIEIQVATRDLVTKNVDKLISIRVMTDSPNGYFLTLEVHVVAEEPFAIVPASLALGRIPENGGGAGKVEIVQAGGLHYELREVVGVPPGIEAELGYEARAGYPVWTLALRVEPPLQRGSFSQTVRISTEESPGVPGHEVEVPVTALVVGDFAAEPERIVFAATRDAVHRSSVEFGSLLAGQRARVTGVDVPEAQRAWLTARAEALDPDDAGTSRRWLLTLETVPTLPAQDMLAGKLVVHMDDAQYPTWEVEYVVHVR